MSKQASPTLIGAFVIGGLGLLVAVILVLGSNAWFTPANRFVLFFPGAVNGLSVGAPVEFRGVRIGSVVDIRVVYDADNQDVLIPVTVDILEQDLDEAGMVAGQTFEDLDSDVFLQKMIEQDGLRGKLKAKSLLTGQVIVQFDFFPNSPIRLLDIDTKYSQLPTVASGLEELNKAFTDFPIGDLLAKVNDILQELQAILESGAPHKLLANASLAAEEASLLMVDARERLDVMSVSLDSTLLVARERLALEPGEPLYQFNETLGRYEQLARNLDAEIKPTAEQIRRAVAEAKRASVVARDTLVAVQDLVNPKAPLYVDLTRALRAVSSAADSVRSLASYLERNPNALLRGKSTRHR